MVADDFASDLFVPYGDPLFFHMPFFLEAAILSRTRSPITSRSNWAKDNRTFSGSRPYWSWC